MRISADAKGLAEELGVDPEKVKGTGKQGFITKEDIQQAAKKAGESKRGGRGDKPVGPPSTPTRGPKSSPKGVINKGAAIAIKSTAIRDGRVFFKVVGTAIVGEFRSGPYLRSRDYGKNVLVPEGDLYVEIPLGDGHLTEEGNLTIAGLQDLIRQHTSAVIVPLSTLVRDLEPEIFEEELPLVEKAKEEVGPILEPLEVKGELEEGLAF